MKIALITGSNGALGRSMVEYFRKKSNFKVVATSRRGAYQGDVKLDIENSDELKNLIEYTKPDLILHLAATFENNFEKAYSVNVESTRQLLKTVEKSKKHVRVLLMGSAAEYGMVRPEENPIREDHILSPVSIYGLTKAWQTILSGVYASRGVDVVIARAFNFYGPGLSDRLFVGRLQKQIDAVLNGQKSIIETGSLKSIRDYISTDEAVAQIFAIATKGNPGRVYHVGSGKPTKIRDLLNRQLTIHNLDVSIVHEAENLTNRLGFDVPEIYADIENTLQLL